MSSALCMKSAGQNFVKNFYQHMLGIYEYLLRTRKLLTSHWKWNIISKEEGGRKKDGEYILCQKCKRARSKRRFHHLSRASELCQEFLSPLGYGAWGEVLGKFHDFGKYSEDFQQVLRREKTHVNHAGPGAALVFQAYGGWSHGGKGQNWAAKLLASVIASHHGELSLVDDGVLKRVLRGEGDRLDSEGAQIFSFWPGGIPGCRIPVEERVYASQAVATPAGVFRRGRCIFSEDAVDAVSVFCLGGCGLFQRCGTSEARLFAPKPRA
ncbi:MAG: CRISPR-associated endonuclease Cas3'' [Oscillospiraceae bacterium]